MRSRRCWLALLTTSLAACVTGTVEIGGPGGAGGVLTVSAGAPPGRVDYHLRDVAEGLWKTVVVKCGDSHFAIVRSSPLNGLELNEYKGVTFTVHGDEVTEADRRSGLRWKGHTTMCAASKRRRSSDSTWSDWTAAAQVADIHLELKDGWNLGQARSALGEVWGFASAPDCPTLRPSP
jgi:hypothetical protein